MRRTLTNFLAVLLLASVAASAAEFWEKKDYRRWSEKDCRKMLQNSPWAKQRIFSQVHITRLGVGGGVRGPQDDPTRRERQANPRITYQVQLRSALPVRQALVRLQQHRMGYDKLAEEERRAFDEQAEAFLRRDLSDVVVIYVMYGSTVRTDVLDLRRYWQNQTTTTLKNTTFLIGRHGRKTDLKQYVVVKGGRQAFQFKFPRYVDGQPLVGSQDKSLQLEFVHPNIRGQGQERVLLEFKVKKMVVEDEVVY